LALGNDVRHILVDLDLKRIDVMVVCDHFVGQAEIAAGQRFDGTGDLFFHQTAHFQDVGAYAFQVHVKLLEGMFSGHLYISWSWSIISRTMTFA